MNVRGDFLKFPHSTNTTALICKSRKEPAQHLVRKRTAQKDITIDTTSDSQVNSNFPNRWSPASLTFNNYFSFAPNFRCCYFCESSWLFYLRFDSDFYVSKIMLL